MPARVRTTDDDRRPEAGRSPGRLGGRSVDERVMASDRRQPGRTGQLVVGEMTVTDGVPRRSRHGNARDAATAIADGTMMIPAPAAAAEERGPTAATVARSSSAQTAVR